MSTDTDLNTSDHKPVFARFELSVPKSYEASTQHARVLCCVVLSTVQYKTQYSDPAARHVGARRVLTVRHNNATRGVATMSS